MNTERTVSVSLAFGWIMSYRFATLRSGSARIGKPAASDGMSRGFGPAVPGVDNGPSASSQDDVDSLLAIVPIVTVALTIITAFPVFGEMTAALQEFILENMVPASADVVASYTQQFTQNAARLTAVGIGFLFRGFAAGRMGIVAPVSAVLATALPVIFNALIIVVLSPLALNG